MQSYIYVCTTIPLCLTINTLALFSIDVSVQGEQINRVIHIIQSSTETATNNKADMQFALLS